MTAFRTLIRVAVPVSIVSIAYGTFAQFKQPYAPVYANGEINSNIVLLAEIQQPNATLPAKNSLSAWNTYLQKSFLRPAGIDHQDMANMHQDPNHAQMEHIFNEMGMVQDIYPSQIEYDYVFIFGGTPSHTNERFKFLQQNIDNKKINVSTNVKVTYINGRRKIAPSEVIEAKNLGVDCEYQHQCAELIWAAHYNGLPVKLEVMTIDPPEGRRANTDDTLKAFYARIPLDQSAKVLGYSNQPYVPYQGDTAMAVAEKTDRMDLEIEVVGAHSPTPVATITYLDSIARRVFTAASLRR